MFRCATAATWKLPRGSLCRHFETRHILAHDNVGAGRTLSSDSLDIGSSNGLGRSTNQKLFFEKSQSRQHRYGQLLQQRDFSKKSSLHSSRGIKRKRPLRSYQKKAEDFLEKVHSNRIEDRLITQKVEEIFLLSLSEYSDNQPSDYRMALDLLKSALQYARRFSKDKGTSGERLFPRLFSLACQIMLRSGHPRAISEAHRQIWRLLEGHESFFVQNDADYNTHHVNDACAFYVRFLVMEANNQRRKLGYRESEQLHQLLDYLEELHMDASVPISPSPHVDDSRIMLLCKQFKPREAHDILRKRVEEASVTANLDETSPLTSSFVTLINGYARTFQPASALNVVEWMVSAQTTKTKVNASSIPTPNVHCFNALLHAYAMAGGKDAGFEAEKTLKWMEQISEEANIDATPNEASYNICINAWARSKHFEAPTRAENILRHLIFMGETGSQVEPSEEAFTAVMNAWVNSCGNGTSPKKLIEATDRVSEILKIMERTAENSERISMSIIPYSVLIKAWEKLGRQSRGVTKEKCTDEILKVVERMTAGSVAPTTEIYNSVLAALGDISAIDGIIYFLELEHEYCRGNVQLDTRTFNCGLNAVAALNRPDAVKRATDVLNRMFEYHETDPMILPSSLTFNIILKILSRSTSHVIDAAAKADDLLSEMESMPSVTPDFISYVTCIIAWGRSEEKQKMKRVRNLLHRFVDFTKEDQNQGDKRSSIAVFNAVLSVCHHNTSTEHFLESLQMAQDTMQELRKTDGIFPDQITYDSFFRIVRGGKLTDQLPSSSLLSMIEEEFRQCVEDGYITHDVLEALHHVVPKSMFAVIMGKDVAPRTFSIPKAWCRNIVRQKEKAA